MNSQARALEDHRGLVFGGGHGGLGNQLWAAAAVISVSVASGRLPVLPCNSCYRWEALRQVHCVPFKGGRLHMPSDVKTMRVGWGEAPDASANDVAKYLDADAKKNKVVQVTGWTQSYYSFQSHWQTVCWALKPRREVQEAAQQYFDNILSENNAVITAATKIVTIHLRRGDYVGKQNVHGLLTIDYYKAAVKMIHSRVLKEHPESAKEGARISVHVCCS